MGARQQAVNNAFSATATFVGSKRWLKGQEMTATAIKSMESTKRIQVNQWKKYNETLKGLGAKGVGEMIDVEMSTSTGYPIKMKDTHNIIKDPKTGKIITERVRGGALSKEGEGK